jgi:hypothetical protein
MMEAFGCAQRSRKWPGIVVSLFTKMLLIHGGALRRRHADQMTVPAQLITCSNAKPLRSDMRLVLHPAGSCSQHQSLYAPNGARNK